jgi:RNA polymerase sigma factor (TIGR02999 family)
MTSDQIVPGEACAGTASALPRSEESAVAALLADLSQGDRSALNRLLPLVYDALRRLAHRALRGERRGHTLNTTALAHEAYVKLVGLERIQWQDRSHFLAIAALAMRRILVDHAVSRKAQKRGGGIAPEELEEGLLVSDDRLEEVLMLDQALQRLEAIDAAVVRIVQCRIFVGMSIDETATALALSPATVKRHWQAARAWLTRELSPLPS